MNNVHYVTAMSADGTEYACRCGAVGDRDAWTRHLRNNGQVTDPLVAVLHRIADSLETIEQHG